MQNKDQFLEWFHILVSEIGPIYWPPGRSGRLSWPVDRAALVFPFFCHSMFFILSDCVLEGGAILTFYINITELRTYCSRR